MTTRDSKAWNLMLILAILIFASANWGMVQAAFPTLDPVWQHRVELAAALWAALSAKMSTSPLPLSRAGRDAYEDADRLKKGYSPRPRD